MTTAPNTIRTGGEIDAFCTKCELNLAHTIIAMVGAKVVKVKCNTCGADHAYKGEQPLMKAASFARPKKSKATPRAEKAVLGWEERLKGKNVAGAKKYNPKEYFQVDDVIDHPTFGLGLVTANRPDKIDVAFKAFEKTLVNGKAPPRPPPPPKQFGKPFGKPFGRPGPKPAPATAASLSPAPDDGEEPKPEVDEDEVEKDEAETDAPEGDAPPETDEA